MGERLQQEGAAEASTSNSQDSLSSTGSNRELKDQLDSTIAQVEAFAKEIIEKRKLSTVSLSPALEAGKSGEERRGAEGGAGGEGRQQRSVSIGGARPRLSVQEQRQQHQGRPLPGSRAGGGVMLRESSWGSRDQALNLPSQPMPLLPSATKTGSTNVPSFAKNRNLWEKRTVKEEGSGGGGMAVAGSLSARGGAFRSKELWSQRTSGGAPSSSSSAARQKQTPDLVLGLPISQQRRQQQQQQQQQQQRSGRAAGPSPKGEQAVPVPKPRTLAATSSTPPPSSPEDSPPPSNVKAGEKSARRGRSPPSRSASREEEKAEEAAVPPGQPRVSAAAAAAAALALRQRPNPLEATTVASTRPQVRVKPQVQSRKSPPNEGEDKKEAK